MRRITGNMLIAVAVLGAVGAILLAGVSLGQMGRTYPTSDRYAAAEGGLRLAGALLGLDAILFLSGRSLRQSRPGRGPEGQGGHRHRRVLPLVLYLGVSMGIGLLAGLGPGIMSGLGPLAFLLYQPTFLVQILLGGVLGPTLEGRAEWRTVLVAANLLYFVVLFYPVYSLGVMDWRAEVARRRRMKAILILGAGVHVLIGLARTAVLRA